MKDSRDFSSPGVESSRMLVGYKDVLAHLDGTEEDEIRLRYAEAIAAIFGARLAGIFTNRLPYCQLWLPAWSNGVHGT